MSAPHTHTLRRAGDWRGPHETIALDYEARFLRRRRLISDQGSAFHVDLAETVSLDESDAFVLPDGRHVRVIAAPEPLLAVTGPALARLAWHIGNRHTPCRIEPDRLLIRRDPVLADMLRGLGAQVAEVTEPFRPEGGAYGIGRTMGHEHGHGH
ncbi:urease accessory protein UreE [Rhodobacteraceae bacterium WD3A24]|nr:urease accessory protein UreE [Rhodobacteraceae bacterium WD3A24]